MQGVPATSIPVAPMCGLPFLPFPHGSLWQLSYSHSPLGFGQAGVGGLFFSLWSLTCSTNASQRIVYLLEILDLKMVEATGSFFWGGFEHTAYDLSLSESVLIRRRT